MYDRGVVVVAAGPFGNTPRRPYVIVSKQNHPFAGDQYVGLGISTKKYHDSIPLQNSYETGSLERDSFISPWEVVSLRDLDVVRAVARVTSKCVETAVDRLISYVRA